MFFKESHINNEVKSLTSFRFIAAFIVFLFHCKIHLDYEFGFKLINKFIGNGAVFMTAFFVLSGYILCHVYYGKNFSNKDQLISYYFKRFARVYPTYFLATVVYFIFYTPEKGYQLGDWIRIIVNDLFCTQAFFPNMFNLGINSGTWSISVEMFFYFFFPFIMIFLSKSAKSLFLFSLIATIIISVNVVCEEDSLGKVFGYYTNPLLRINEFMMGISFCLFKKEDLIKNKIGILNSIFFVSFLIFLFSALEQSKFRFEFMGLNFLLVPLFGLLIYNFHNSSSKILSNRIFCYLGKISYSFYLWQFVAIELAKNFNDKFLTNGWLLIILTLIINVVLSCVSYHLIEERFRKIVLKNKNFLKIKLLK